MNNVISSKDNHNHTLVFTGKGGKYFVICLVNFLLTCITLGIYAPWAMVKCRRYIYTNMTLNNQPFAYKATGGALFISVLLVFIIYIVSLSLIEHGHPGLGFTLFGLLIAIIPFMAVKGLQYQAMMTSLNGVHFGFQCSMRRAWWYMFALPVLLMVALYIVLYIISLVTIAVGGLVFNIVFLGLLAIIGIGVINGITYSKWMTLFGNGANFGIHRFSIQVNVKTCIRGCVLAMLTLFPFAVVIGYLIAPVFTDMILLSMMGECAGRRGAYSAILWPDNGMLFPLFSRDYCGNQLLICGVTQPVFKQFVTGERFDSFSFLCHCTRYAVAVTGGVCDFRRDLRAGLSVVENLAGELAGAEYTGPGRSGFA